MVLVDDKGTSYISIHPPRVGRDRPRLATRTRMTDFNPPSPCGEGHLLTSMLSIFFYFNPPSPCGEGPLTCFVYSKPTTISIHPPRVGRDLGGAG